MKNLGLILVMSAALFFIGCSEQQDRDHLGGKKLAQVHCASCHSFPDPSLLDKTTWETDLLPVMGLKLGIVEPTEEAETNMTRLLVAGAYAKEPVISREDWKKIKNYYLNEAPAMLNYGRRHKTMEPTGLFEARALDLDPDYPAGTTCVKIDTARGGIWIADAAIGQIFNLDYKGSIKSYPSDLTVSDINLNGKGNEILLTSIGHSLQPTENKDGDLTSFERGPEASSTRSQQTLVNNLGRPVETLRADITGDGKDEVLISEFGFRTGKLAYWQERDDGTYREHVLKNEAGAVTSILNDIDDDGDTDIIGLFAQADEKIVLFRNDGVERFQEIELLNFPPSYGSTHFEMMDFNGDGLLDILYTSGDNADYTTVLKPYHGIYLYLNKGDLSFEQAYFYPMHGAYKAMAKDYDMDGDMDIAAIAYFADYENFPENSFVYLQQDGSLNFTPQTLPIHTLGRWITMDAGDYDGDGDEDIVLGNNIAWSRTENTIKEWDVSSEIVILKNQKIMGAGLR